MKTANNSAARLIFAMAVFATLAGCAVYTPGPGYYVTDDSRVYAVPPPVYVAPPVYVGPGYVGPPVLFNFGFSTGHYRGYRGYHGYHGYRGYRGWYGGGRGYGGGHYRHGR